MDKFNKIYKNFNPSTKKLGSLSPEQITQIDILVDYIASHLPKYKTKEEQKAIFETLLEELETIMRVYQDGW
jgi:hypothetical protein